MNYNVYIQGNLLFEGNQAQNGGAMYISDHAEIKFSHNSNVMFKNNTANKGGAIYINNNVSVVCEGKSMSKSTENNMINDGTIHSNSCSNNTFIEDPTVSFINNNAREEGGAIYVHGNSIITYKDKCKVVFKGNEADTGGAIYHSNSNM